MLEAAALIRSGLDSVQFILPLAETIEPADVQGALAAAPMAVRLVQHQTYEVMQLADVLLVASGTATLEAALLGTPMVIAYKGHLLSYLLARLLMRVRCIGLPNIIAGHPIVPELHQYAVTAEHMAAQALELLTHADRAATMRIELAKIRRQLGTPGVPEHVARGVLRYLETCTAQAGRAGISARMAQACPRERPT
jgi:lipid-A-disaccharide synthase